MVCRFPACIGWECLIGTEPSKDNIIAAKAKCHCVSPCNYPRCAGLQCAIVPETVWVPCDRCTDPMDCGSWKSCHNKARPDRRDVQFEQLLSYRPYGQDICLRDAVFDYFCKMLKDTDRANAATKQFTDQIHRLFRDQKP